MDTLSPETSLAASLVAIRRCAAELLGADPRAAEGSTLAAPRADRFADLTERFALTPLGRDALVCLFAAEYDPLMRLVARTIQGQVQAGLEVGTIAELLRLPVERAPELAALLAADGPLATAGLVAVDGEAGLAVASHARIERRIARHLVGDDRLPEDIDWLWPDAPPLLAGALPRDFDSVLARLRRAHAAGERALVEIAGAQGTGKRSLAHRLACELGAPLALVDLAHAAPSELGRKLRDGAREARLGRGLLGVAAWDEALDRAAAPSPEGESAPSKPRIPRELVRLVRDFEGILFLTSETSHATLLRNLGAPVLSLDVPFPGPSQRTKILQHALAFTGVAAPPVEELESVARRYALDPARLRAAAHEASAAAGARGAALDEGELARACRLHLRHDFAGLAERVSNNHGLTDLVVAPEISDTLREMISFVRDANTVYDRWGFGRRHSLMENVSALFAGPPGTGKTMCASVIARELDMELFRVDLSRVVSKWVGETEKNLSRVFDEAERSSAILLFDEADSLFAKRTGVKTASDRYANLEVNYLLQRLETFRGISILTTNYEDSIDPAFKRRLTFRVRFEKPDVETRAELWRKVFPSAAELAGDVDPEALARISELSGASIRNAAVRAAFLAAAQRRPIDMELCIAATLREATEMGLVTHVPARRGDDDEAPAYAREYDDDARYAARADDYGDDDDAIALPNGRVRPIAVTHHRPIALPEPLG